MVRDRGGTDIEPEPRLVSIDEVASQILAEAAGLEPAALLEASGVATQLRASTTAAEEGAMERSGVDEQELRHQATRSLSSIRDRD